MIGPPGYGRPSSLATLSNASPAASSRVRPMFSYFHPPARSSAVRLVRSDLGRNNIRKDLLTRAHHRRRGLVAGGLDPQDASFGHTSILLQLAEHEVLRWQLANSS